jgi:hypothetical protein
MPGVHTDYTQIVNSEISNTFVRNLDKLCIPHLPMAFSPKDKSRLLCKYYNQDLSFAKTVTMEKEIFLYKYYSESRVMKSNMSIHYIIPPFTDHLLAAPLDLLECLDTVETFLSPWTGH